jgi:hypothetical protein
MTIRKLDLCVKEKGPQERGDGKCLFNVSRLSMSILPRRGSE